MLWKCLRGTRQLTAENGLFFFLTPQVCEKQPLLTLWGRDSASAAPSGIVESLVGAVLVLVPHL